MFFITRKFLKVTHSFRNSSGYLHKWRLLLFTRSFLWGYKIVLKWVKVVAPITAHCRSQSMNAYDFTDRAWEQVVFLANNTYFFPARDVFGTYLFIYLFIYRFVQCTGERTIGHVVPYLVHPPNPTPFSSQFSLLVQIYLAYQVLICKMYYYLRSRWFTDAAKNNVKQTQWGTW